MSERLGDSVLELRTDDRRYNRGMREAHQRARRLDSRFVGMGDSLGRVATQAIALGAVTFGGTAFVSGIVRARMELDRIDSTLRAGTGSREAAAREMAFVAAEAERLGLDLSTAALQFAQLTAAAKGTELAGQGAREIFTSVAEASTVLGLSADQASGALNAIQQMISKGTVSAEELRGQLGERLPGAFQMAARSMGVTTRELGQMLQRGEIMAEDLLPRLAAEMRASFGPQVPAASRTLRAEFARLQTQVTLLQGELGDGAEDGLSGAARGAADALEALRTASEGISDDQSIINWAAATATAITSVADVARTTLFVLDNGFTSLGTRLGGLAAAARKAAEGDMESARVIMAEMRRDLAGLEQEIADFDSDAFRQRMLDILAGTEDPLQPIDTSAFPERRGTTGDGLTPIDTAGMEEQRRSMKGLNSVFREAQRIYEATRRPAEAYADEIERLIEHLDAGTIDQETFRRAVAQAGEQFVRASGEAEKASEEMSVFAQEAARNIQSSFADFLFDPLDEGFEGMVEGFARAIQRMLAEAAAARILEGMFGEDGGLGSFLSGFMPSFGGGRALGGRVSAGVPYVVGERRPEMFVPDSAGRIQPRISGGGTSIEIFDQRGAGAPPIEIEKIMRNGQEAQRMTIRSEVAGMVGDGSMSQLFRAHGFGINHRGHR